ncbi:hypothetical protein G210_2022 [Candida maltosa Xu316]|uniref:Uncharacterized protein n=1 Tax=Candida maltosa (strain Xu316) TaxID=1245528 RepID=M3HJQ4_CANMX|nr:hypothetical protein G210_2022 [Candida maltosa Xu316]
MGHSQLFSVVFQMLSIDDMSTLIIGATGLVGSEIVKYADTSSTLTDVEILTRRSPTIESTEIKLIESVEIDSEFESTNSGKKKKKNQTKYSGLVDSDVLAA